MSRTRSVAEQAVATAFKEFGRLDFAVNNAGISPWTGNTVECTFETWRRVLDVNLTGTWLGMKYQIPAIVKGGRGGAIVNMTRSRRCRCSKAILLFRQASGASSASPRWRQGSSRQGVRVNAIAPGSIETPLFATWSTAPHSRDDYEKQTPMGRIAKAEEVAAAAAWLCSDAASYVTGAVLPVDGGMTL